MKSKSFYVKLDFNDFYREVESRTDEELVAWTRAFAHSLFFMSERNDYALSLRLAAEGSSKKYAESGAKGAEKRWRNNDENSNANGNANGEANVNAYSMNRTEENRREEKKKTRATSKGTIPFEAFLYSYPIANGQKPAEAIWKKMTDDERQAAIDAVPAYKKTVSDNKFLKHCQNYLKDKVWLEHSQQQKPSQPKPMVIIQDRAAPPMTFDNMGFNNA